MVGKKLEGFDIAESGLQVKIDKGFKDVCKALVEKVPTIEPQSIAKIVRALIENPMVLYELTETRASFGELRFLKCNVGEQVDVDSLLQCCGCG